MKQISSCLKVPEEAGREGERHQKEQKKLLGLQNTLVIVKASQVYTHVKTYQVVHFTCSLSHQNKVAKFYPRN